jgi:hypothetical protein
VTSTLNSIKHVINDRISSPLAGSFIISWLIVNYKFLIVLFSLQSVENKFVLISFLFPIDIWLPALTTFSKLVVIPLAFTVFYIYLYPIPARKVYEHVRKEQIKLEDLRNEIEKASVLTNEQATNLKRQHYLEVSALRADLNKRDDEISNLRNIMDSTQKEKEFTNAIETLESSDINTDDDLKEEADFLTNEAESYLKSNKKIEFCNVNNFEMKDLDVLTTLYEHFNNRNLSNMNQFIRQFQQHFEIGKLQLENTLDKLIEMHIIDIDESIEIHIQVTAKGKEILTEYLNL